MALTTSPDIHTDDVRDFYEALSADYDLMTGFQDRFIRERPFFHMIVEKYHIQSALDAGCGTGFHSFLLTQLEVKVTAVDLSPGMITLLRRHARKLGLSVTTFVTRFDSLPKSLDGSFDAVFSLGNTLAHSSSPDELQESLLSFGKVLRPGGIVFLQNLNYDRILGDREKVQSVKEAGGKTFVRYYDYDEKGVVFNILTIEKTADGILQNHRTVRLLPLLRRDLVKALEAAGFIGIRIFGGISMNDYIEGSSKDLVVLAQRP